MNIVMTFIAGWVFGNFCMLLLMCLMAASRDDDDIPTNDKTKRQ